MGVGVFGVDYFVVMLYILHEKFLNTNLDFFGGTK